MQTFVSTSYDIADSPMRTPDISRQVVGSSLVKSSSQVDVLADFLQVSRQKLKLTVLFSSVVSGWSPAEFHASCDQKGATITLIRCGRLCFGGYASVSWSSRGLGSSQCWLEDPRAFLFRFKYDSHQKTVTEIQRFDRNGAGGELYSRADYGPTFGYKHDLFTFGQVSPGQNQTVLSDVRGNGIPSFSTPSLLYDASSRDACHPTLEVLQVGTAKAADGLEELEQPWLSGFPWAQEVHIPQFLSAP